MSQTLFVISVPLATGENKTLKFTHNNVCVYVCICDTVSLWQQSQKRVETFYNFTRTS